MIKVQNFFEALIKRDSSAGLVLMTAALLAMIASNTGLAPFYDLLLNTNVRVGIGNFEISKPALLWINDGLMAIFFFLVGLEIKREVIIGNLSRLDRATLPILAAFGGMAIPGIIFAAINWQDPETLRGWAIPAATDIAFALGILALLGPRVPVALKVFLLAVAIFDDLGAIIIIALFYTSELSTNALTFSMLGFAMAVSLNRLGVQRIGPYLIIGIVMWVFVLKSGVHATLAGVLIALTIPLKEARKGKSLLERTEHALHPYVSFLILPIFAFANAGVSLRGLSSDDLAQPLTLGIACGLFFGKQIGVFGAAWLGVKLGIAKLPAGVGWSQIFGVACLTGIGFTMSLFIGALAFDDVSQMNAVRLGVMLGSLCAGLTGYFILRATLRQSQLATS